MKDILIGFEDTRLVPSRVRLIGLLRIINIIVVLLLTIALVLNTMDMKEQAEPSIYFGTAALSLLFGITGILSIIYSVQQLRFEFLLDPKCYAKNKFRWSSNVFNFFILFSIMMALIMMPRTEVQFSAMFIVFFALIGLQSIILMIADFIYFFKRRKFDETKKATLE